MINKIASSQNEKIKNIVKLRGSSGERKNQGLFLIEGWREINLALKGGVEIVNLFFCADYGKRKLAVAEEKIIEISEKVFAKISWRENPDGLLAVAKDAVIMKDAKTDIYNPNVIRASQGTAFTVPTVLSAIGETAAFCRKNKIKIFAAAPSAKLEYTKADYTAGCAIVLGAEDKGLSEKWLKAADEKIRINMRGKIDSLNVSVSAAVILFEAVRQRKK